MEGGQKGIRGEGKRELGGSREGRREKREGEGWSRHPINLYFYTILYHLPLMSSSTIPISLIQVYQKKTQHYYEETLKKIKYIVKRNLT